jgi:hypothetical protein
MDLLQAAGKCSRFFHKGQHFKYVEGAYWEHPKSVSERMHSVDEKVLALLHDVGEEIVKQRLKEIKAPTPEQEEEAVAYALDRIRRYFQKRHCTIDYLLPDLDVLTRRSYWTYGFYIGNIIDHCARTGALRAAKVKLADLEDNRDPDRNRPVALQTDKDKARLLRYDFSRARILKAYPQITLRLGRNNRPPPVSRARKPAENWPKRNISLGFGD